MPVVGLDHLAITVADVEATLDWYERVLGAERLLYDLWRAGTIPIAMLQVGASRLSVHPASAPASPHAHVPTPGSADVCFRFAGPVADAVAMVGAAGVAIVEGRCRAPPPPASAACRSTSRTPTATWWSCSPTTDTAGPRSAPG